MIQSWLELPGVVFLAGAAAALLLVPAFRLVALRAGFVDRPDGVLKTQAAPVPYLGGAGTWAGWIIGVALLQRAVSSVLVLMLATLLILGTVDDRLDLHPALRLTLELLMGGAVAWAVPAGSSLLQGLPLLAVPLGAVALATAVNAVNMVDGLDGLAGGTAALACAGLAFLAVWSGDQQQELLAVSAAGAILGFLVYNRPPAWVYLGDGGSYVTGGLLFSLVYALATDWRSAVAALLMVGFFLLEIGSTVLRRLRRGTHLGQGDRTHLYDNMRSRGLSPWGVLLRCLLVEGVCVAGGLLTARLPAGGWTAVVALGTVAGALLLLRVCGALSAPSGGRP